MQLFTKLLFILATFTSLTSQAQTDKMILIEGIVINASTLEPIPFANIGILYTEVGTLSNEDGSFSVRIPKNYINGNLIFSSVGYEKSEIQIKTVKTSEPLEVALTEIVVQLDEIVITTEKFKKQKKVFGNGKSLLLNGFSRGDVTYAGSAAALLINKSQFPELTYIRGASLHIAINKMPTFKIRMRLLSVDSTNGLKPGEDILYEQVLLESSIKKGWLTFPLKKIHQIEEEAFYLTFEWIVDKDDRKSINEVYERYFEEYPEKVRYDTTIIDGEEITDRILPRALAGTFFGVTSSRKDINRHISYARDHSFGEWERLGDALSARIEIANYPLELNQNELNTQPLSIADSITQWVETFRTEQSIPGLQLAIMKHDRLIYSNALGYSDKIKEIEAKSTTQFRIASVSKTMTSAGLMKLVSQGKVDLDKPVQYYVPSFPQKKHPITVRQLLSHLGGIRDYFGISWEEEIFIQEHYKNSTEAISIFSNDSLVAKPGTEFVYSSFGYNLLGAVIEGASNQSYLEYMNEEIWKPLNMNSTYGDIADSTMTHKSKFYFLSEEEATPYDLSSTYPGGGLISTSNDLVKFGSSMLTGRLLNDSLLNQVFETQYTSDGESTGYGLGWYIGKDSNGMKVWYHAGELPSSGSIVLVYPEHGVVIALLANSPIISDSNDGFSDEIQGLSEMIYRHNGW